MGVSAKEIPPWLLPDSCLTRAIIESAERNRVRPDILLVEMTQSECTMYRRPAEGHIELSTTMNSQRSSRAESSSGPRQGKVWLIEGAYTSDTRHFEKLAEKKHQHHILMDALTQRGFDAKFVVFAFGVGGTIYRQSLEEMRQLGVSTAVITKTLQDIHLHSVTRATHIITQR